MDADLEHWLVVGGVVLSVASGGLSAGAAISLVVAGDEATTTLVLTWVAFGTTLGSGAIDFYNCMNGDTAACAGAALSMASAIPGVAAAAGGESDLAKGLAAASANAGIAGTFYDTTTACVGPSPSTAKSSPGCKKKTSPKKTKKKPKPNPKH